MSELIAYAKARPGQVLYASGGQGSTPHLCTEMFKKERLLGVGAEALIQTPAGFGEFLRSETQRWSKVIRDAGLKPQ